MTAEELISLPRGRGRTELVKGVLRRMSPAGHVHGKVAAGLTISLGAFVREHALGVVYAAETGFLLGRDPDTVRAPDAAFVRATTLARLTLAAGGYFPGAPDLAIEVVSPSDAYSDVEGKIAAWLGAGCQVVVVVDPQRRVATIHRSAVEVVALRETDQLTVPDLLPGWSLALEEMFR